MAVAQAALGCGAGSSGTEPQGSGGAPAATGGSSATGGTQAATGGQAGGSVSGTGGSSSGSAPATGGGSGSGSGGTAGGAGRAGSGGASPTGGSGGAAGRSGTGGAAGSGGGATGTGGSAYAPRPAAGACAIMPLGDSITEGYRSSKGGGYRVELFHDALADNKSVTFVGSADPNGPATVRGVAFPPDNEGHGGYRIWQISGTRPSSRSCTECRDNVAPTMFVLGHLGIGKRLAAHPYRRFSRVDKRAFFVGALLPDLIDKPLYYGWSWLTGKHGAEAGLISGTHLFGHTGLFLLALARSRAGHARSRPCGRSRSAWRPTWRSTSWASRWTCTHCFGPCSAGNFPATRSEA